MQCLEVTVWFQNEEYGPEGNLNEKNEGMDRKKASLRNTVQAQAGVPEYLLAKI